MAKDNRSKQRRRNRSCSESVVGECRPGRDEWREAWAPAALLSNLGDALQHALADTAHGGFPNLRSTLFDGCADSAKAVGTRRRRHGAAGKRRVGVASVSLSQTGGADSSVAGEVQDAGQRSPFKRGAGPGAGWFSEVGRTRTFYKQISVAERARIGAIAGGLAGAFTYCCLHPIDTVRTRLQTRGAAKVYSNGLEVVVSILKTRGILGFYSGISAVLVGSTLSSAVYFGCIELGRTALVKYTSCSPLLIPPLSGAFGNIVSSTILVPKDVITQRMQAGAAGRSWNLALRTVRNEGLRGLYSGYGAALLRNLPSSVLSFTTFEYVKAVWLKYTGQQSLQPSQSVLAGALAGAISGALTTPLDVVKTRLMTQAKKGVMGPVAGDAAAAEIRAQIAATSYKGITATMKQIWTDEGWVALTKGMGPRLLHSALFSALGYLAFETVRVELVKRQMAKLQSSETGPGAPAVIL